jgi:hypothetical protein
MESKETPQRNGGIVNYFQGATIHNIVINGNMNRSGTEHYSNKAEDESRDDMPSQEQIAKAVEKVKPLFWGTSAIATIFCVCRDRYNTTLNVSEFERQMITQGIECPEGTIRNAMKNNPYMRLPIDKWTANGAKERVMILAREFEEKLVTSE